MSASTSRALSRLPIVQLPPASHRRKLHDRRGASAWADGGEQCVVQQAVARGGIALHHAVDPVEAGEAATRLDDDRSDCRHVPQRQARARRRCRPLPRRAACRTRSRHTPGCARPARSARRTGRGRRAPTTRRSRRRTGSHRQRGDPRDGQPPRLAAQRRRPRRPDPRADHHRRPSEGAETTPTTGTSPSSRAMSVAHTGTPRTKLLVPSIGSMTHRRDRVAGPPELLAPHRIGRASVGRCFDAAIPRPPGRRR